MQMSQDLRIYPYCNFVPPRKSPLAQFSRQITRGLHERRLQQAGEARGEVIKRAEDAFRAVRAAEDNLAVAFLALLLCGGVVNLVNI